MCHFVSFLKKPFWKERFFHPYGNVNGGIFLAGDMLSTREVRLDYEESENVRIYRDALLRMKEVCLGQNVQAIYVSRHDNLVPM